MSDDKQSDLMPSLQGNHFSKPIQRGFQSEPASSDGINGAQFDATIDADTSETLANLKKLQKTGLFKKAHFRFPLYFNYKD